jgi:Ca2+:H+ antiporter
MVSPAHLSKGGGDDQSLVSRFSRAWTRWLPVVVLGGATALTAVVSESLVGTIDPLAKSIGLSPFFVGLIVLPIVGNAAEHTSAVTMALSDRMETTMAITAGSSIQIALLVAPVLVLVSAFMGSTLDLDFNGLELITLGLIAGLYALVSLDGESTWLEGLLLGAFYLIVAAVAFFIPG